MTTRTRCAGSDLIVTDSILLGPRNKPIPYIVQGPRFYHGIAARHVAIMEARDYGAMGMWRLKRKKR